MRDECSEEHQRGHSAGNTELWLPDLIEYQFGATLGAAAEMLAGEAGEQSGERQEIEQPWMLPVQFRHKIQRPQEHGPGESGHHADDAGATCESCVSAGMHVSREPRDRVRGGQRTFRP